MSRAERNGLILAIAGHILLFAILSLSLMMRSRPVPSVPVMDVQLIDNIGEQTSAPKASMDLPETSEAPERGPVEEAPEPTPEPKPTPKPQPAPVAAPEPAPKPKPREKLSSDILKGLKDTPTKSKKATGQRLGPDFLKGITGEKTTGKARTPRAAISGPQVARIGAAIAAQIRPCYARPSGGAGSNQIVTVLRLRFNRDGSIAKNPVLDSNEGVTAENRAYVQQMNDAAIRAVIRCAPLRLPPDLYEGGWEDIISSFSADDLG